MFNPNAYDNAAPAGVAVLETVAVEDGRLVESLAFVPLRRTTVNGRWEGALAELTFTHTYSYTRAQCDRVLEAVYRFPLPGDAAVRRVVVTFGEVEIVAELKERRAAEQEYERAKQEGRQAALTTRESPDVFTLRVAGLQPDQDVVVETTCVLLASDAGAGWSLRIPLTTAPRYVRPDEVEGRRPGRRNPANARPLAIFRDPGHRFALDLITATGSIASATHALQSAGEDGHTRVQLARGEMVPDRDCVLTWMPAQAQDRPALHVLTGVDEAAGRTYFVALVAPPARSVAGEAPAREAIVLVDHSGSMGGNKWQAADRAALGFIRDLSPRDTLNIGVFHSTCRWLSDEPVRAGGDAAARAERFLSAEPDGGGTELGVALEQALMQRRTAGAISRQVVIITDAQVSDEGRILALVEHDARRADRRRVSVLCIDAAPNAHLTTQLATAGGGIARYLTSQPDGAREAGLDVEEALRAILAGWSQPVAVGLALSVNREGLEVSDGRRLSQGAGWSAVDLGDLTMGRSLWIAGRVPTGDGPLVFHVDGAGLQPVEVGATPGPDAGAMGGALKALFGAYRVQGLELLMEQGRYGREGEAELVRLGYDLERLQGQVSAERPLYAQNAERADRANIEDLLLHEALDYGLLCSVTGFVAVRKERGQVIEATSVIGNALPAGWDGDQWLGTNTFAAHAAPQASMPRMSQMPHVVSRSIRPRLMEAGDLTSATRPGPDLAQRAYRLSAPPTGRVHYAGRPATGTDKQAVLFDTDRVEDAQLLTESHAFRQLAVRESQGALDGATLPPRVAVVIEINGRAVALVKLVDLAQQGGQAAVRVDYRAGDRLRVLLVDDDGAWGTTAPEIEITLS
jgi:Ca-activated chloride channel family protein